MMSDFYKEAKLEAAADWIAQKGVSIWPNCPDDPQERDGQEDLAEWFLNEIDDFDRFFADWWPKRMAVNQTKLL